MTDLDLATNEDMFDALPPAPTFEAWADAGLRIAADHASLHWRLGDWIAYGAEQWPDRYIAAADATQIPHSTIARAAFVAVAVPPERRRDGLSWSHHAAVAKLDATQQVHWLHRAVEDGLTAKGLAAAIADAERIDEGDQGELPAMPAAPRMPPAKTIQQIASQRGLVRIWVDLATGDCGPL
jgi:hypothetical protein